MIYIKYLTKKKNKKLILSNFFFIIEKYINKNNIKATN